MANRPIILQPREPLLDDVPLRGDKNGILRGVSRSWWGFFNDLKNLSGSLLQPLVIPFNWFFQSGTFTTGGTIAPMDLTAHTLLGNSGAQGAPASPQVVDASLGFSNGTLAMAEQPAGTLFGNADTAAAKPGAILVGSGLTLDSPSRTLSATGGGSPVSGDQALLYSIVDARAPFARLDGRVNTLEILVSTIQDQRAEIAALRASVNDLTTLVLLA